MKSSNAAGGYTGPTTRCGDAHLGAGPFALYG